ncbi:DUF3995 domain-containing protein [Aestuariivita boseongensis]|uniref:DUF3995 domain-containing protein n=1 Tax=Aestuariivita boseongensis TaxID=1470562 RepID=UPI00068360AE|nr:DUF3995 domain-containing protein [Aestuariivita boseongensis]
MTALALILSAAVAALALLHLLWAIGLWVPIRDEAALARAVVDTRAVRRMPGPVPCALVAVALAFAAILPHRPGFPGRDLLIPAIGTVFMLRGVAAYLPSWRKWVPEEPFATLDRKAYGPLCLGLGIGYLILALGGF